MSVDALEIQKITIQRNIIMLLSIIIPIYNVEQYIRACVQSIFQQNIKDTDFELILVDDGTLDNSFQKIEDIIYSHKNIHIIRQQNAGPSVARNTGLKAAKGEYILFVDSDDLLVKNKLSSLINKAIEEKPDLLITQFIKLNDDEIQLWNNDITSCNEFQLKIGSEVFVEEFNPQQCYVWRTIYRRDFLIKNNIFFIPGLYFEDVPFTTECYLKADKSLIASTLLYIYRQRSGSIVSSISIEKLLHMNMVNEYILNMSKQMNLSENTRKVIINNIFYNTISINFWYITHYKNIYPHWREILQDLKKRIPLELFKSSLKQRLTVTCLQYIPSLYVWIRYTVSRKKYGHTEPKQ